MDNLAESDDNSPMEAKTYIIKGDMTPHRLIEISLVSSISVSCPFLVSLRHGIRPVFLLQFAIGGFYYESEDSGHLRCLILLRAHLDEWPKGMVAHPPAVDLAISLYVLCISACVQELFLPAAFSNFEPTCGISCVISPPVDSCIQRRHEGPFMFLS